MPEKLKFVPFHSSVDSSFFQKLSELKLDKFKLDTSSQVILAYYNIKLFTKNSAPLINVSGTSFENHSNEFHRMLPGGSALFAPGNLVNLNTKEQFQEMDKNAYLQASGEKLYQSFKSKEVLTNPALLASLNVLSFSDLKKFKFYYWFSFPSFYTEWMINSSRIESAKEEFDHKIQTWWQTETNDNKKNFFLLDADNNPIALSELVLDDKRNDSIRVGIIDASTYPMIPSWYLRNFLTLLLYYGYTKVEVLVYRFNGSSFWLDLSAMDSSINLNIRQNVPKVTGWEKTSNGSLQPKIADLQSLLSPVSLAEQAVDLNLKLMKWRIIPQIDLDSIKNTKCLLLGAGTLGSYVSRALLGWGVRTITFVDNGKVSFSNPVRQSLYTYEDCLNGGAPKAEAAAKALKQIFPQVNAKGYDLEIPMIGHPVKDMETERQNFELLEKLIEDHDVVYLLMDSRETRWLPTIIANVKHKTVVNAALGFDSFLVMRHGCISESVNFDGEQDVDSQQDKRLGCYFCNDVFAPSDSLTDRTLDQMCTVTRPGVALMASSLAVELMVSIIQHPQKQYALVNDENSTILGELPHQIRGFMHNFNNVKVQAPSYKNCSACSLPILSEFLKHGWGFVVKALNNNKYIEDLSGLTKVQEEAEKAAAEFSISNDVLSDNDSIDEEWL
ncbi:Atg7 protein [Saccharomycopsis crataegensis]|uniref:Ubiquitin-like modifier-activating enzyme ATG7 n=1 Tax=Saccharomycopsis crataegensis TaxID=43959 RepID=A0AAV5QFS6_9ASCO|nr:Atg7 protein [Saccharomycopsis crataegensis]